MPNAGARVRVAGAWLAVASLLLGGALAFHGPLAADLDGQMRMIAAAGTRWAVVHWVAAVALSLFAVVGLLVLAAGSRLTQDWWTVSAWAVLPVGALWTVVTAVAEATAVADAAAAGNRAAFEAWWAFAAGMATGFTFLALAVATIAGNEARTFHRVTPVWASWVGLGAGVASFLGWALGMWLGIAFGNLLWVASSLVMCLWILWFGVALTRTADAG